MEYRDYQADLDARIHKAWGEGARNVCAVLPTGGGKTVVFGGILRKHNGASVAIAHRRELVGQMSNTLARLRVRHRIIAPTPLIRDIVALHVANYGRSYYDANGSCAVAGVDTLTRRDLGSWGNRVTLWVTDECFPAGTLVDGRPIETFRVGDFVQSFDELTGAFSRQKVTRLFKSVAPQHMVRVATRTHHELLCTPGHPFWTRRGWVAAVDLTTEDEVLCDAMHLVRGNDHHHFGAPTLPVPENRQHILPSSVRNGVPGTYLLAEKRAEGFEPLGGNLFGVRGACGPIGASGSILEKHRESVLHLSMRSGVSVPSIFGNHETDEPNLRFKPDEAEKSHGVFGNSAKSESRFEENRASSGFTRGQWKKPDDPRSHGVPNLDGFGFRDAACNSNREKTEQSGKNSPLLQTGFRALGLQNRDRSGWPRPRGGTEATRRKKRSVFVWSRVDRVEVHERSNPNGPDGYAPDGYVYNIEVEGTHTYVAGGVVVHNCHHLLRENKWGKATELFPYARGLGVTATPLRVDGKGLGRHADGVMDALIVGPGMRDLIERGYLTDYRVFAPASDIDLSKVPVSSTTGDYQAVALRDAARKSHITGDIVDSYLRIAKGKLGVTFCVSIELAQETAARFRAGGVPAECVSSETPEAVRAAVLRRFAAREILQLVNVDLFGEGFDLPALEVVSMGRPTESFGLYAQQFGRSLRPLAGKTEAIIIDHVGNVIRHGLPDGRREWTLDRRAKRARSSSDEIPLRACPECTGVYERFHRCCPYCGYAPEPISRSSPEHVDGDLLEMDASFLARLRGEADLMAGPKIPYGATPEVKGAILKRHRELVETQNQLRGQIAWWAGWQRSLGRNDSEGYRRFFHEFGVDVASAQTLRTKEAIELTAKLQRVLRDNGIVS